MIKTVKRRWFDQYWKLTFDDTLWKLPREERIKLFKKEYNSHKFRKGELYDKYLDKMLFKYNLDIDDYYNIAKGETK